MNLFRIIRPSDAVSILNAQLGFCAIVAAIMGNLDGAVLLIIMASIADGLDGYLARRTKASQLGPDLDSLADMISFGAAPAILAIAAFELSAFTLAVAMIYVSCGILRLARFNLSSESDLSFEGLPITASGIAVASSLLLGIPWITFFSMLVLAALMVSTIPYQKVRDARVQAVFGLIILSSAYLIWQKVELIPPGILIMSAVMIYIASPVVMLYLR